MMVGDFVFAKDSYVGHTKWNCSNKVWGFEATRIANDTIIKKVMEPKY